MEGIKRERHTHEKGERDRQRETNEKRGKRETGKGRKR